MFGINGGELIVLLVIVAFVVGPARLPAYAAQLAAFVRGAKAHATAARSQIEREIGAQGPGIDWATLDPRQYDPRRIVREALLDPLPAPARPRDTGDAPPAAVTSPVAPPPPSPTGPGDTVVPDRPTAPDLVDDLEPVPQEAGRPE